MKRSIGTIAIDFDGVIHSYELGWHDGTIYGHLREKAASFMFAMQARGYSVFIMSTRDSSDIVRWCRENIPVLDFDVISPNEHFWNSVLVVGVTDRKLPALVYIDDRGYRHTDWDKTFADINEILKVES